MVLIIGGAYQGKLEYVKNKYLIKDEDINDLVNEAFNENKKCIYHFERILDNESLNLPKVLDQLDDKIIIVEDIFCGVVPIDKELRLKREKVAKLSSDLAKKAKSVIRIYLGLEQVLK